MKIKTISILGMSCQHCVMALQKELSKLNLKALDVKIGSAKIEYDETKISDLQIENAVKEAGFSIKALVDDQDE
jgi:copper chaperone